MLHSTTAVQATAAQIRPFSFDGIAVRTLVQPDGEWFVLKDVIKAMGSTTRTSDAIRSIEQGLGEGVVVDYPLLTKGGEQVVLIVSEAGVSFLLARSNTERGRKLNRFIHMEVLPALRRDGVYGKPGAQQEALEVVSLMRAEIDARGSAWGRAGAEQKRVRKHLRELETLLLADGQLPLALSGPSAAAQALIEATRRH
jgi:prophage antirepressor-like protein